MPQDVYGKLGVAPVINAAGKLTALGGSAQSEAVAKAQSAAARAHVDIGELRAAAGESVASLTGAEAACITPGAAAGLAIAVAAVVAGNDLAKVHRLPDSRGLPNRVLLQAGHAIDFGAPVEQMIRLAGGIPVVIGAANRVSEAHLSAALRDHESLAALLYVQSHHCVQTGMLSLDSCVELCHRAAVPVIVDAAAEGDLARYIAFGADLVTYSGGKAFCGPTSGFIAGRRDLVAACELQHRGIARTMKVGKEQIAGLLAALELYVARNEAADLERCDKVNALLLGAVAGIGKAEAFVKPDEAGRPIHRVAIRARNGAFHVRELVRFLRDGQPSIRTRNHHLDEGIVLFDPREVSLAQAEIVAERVRSFLKGD